MRKVLKLFACLSYVCLQMQRSRSIVAYWKQKKIKDLREFQKSRQTALDEFAKIGLRQKALVRHFRTRKETPTFLAEMDAHLLLGIASASAAPGGVRMLSWLILPFFA